MLKKWLSASRYLVILAVAGSLILATTLFCYGAIHSVELALEVIKGALSGKKMAIAAIELIDYFLLATVFYITAIGLYELFIDASIQVPQWLSVESLDDLKNKLLGVVVTVLGVLFLGQAVTWDGTQNLQGFGFAIAAVIAAITLYTRPTPEKIAAKIADKAEEKADPNAPKSLADSFEEAEKTA